ncbi:glucokinase family protein [Stenotrophomonas sp. MMGLT7]|uniref:glucokinase family protein n=1 Tax=Stenotrophomonas sp. MMGLT7 TaxID=2901227 RepID=UPI001E608E7D|nr:glucokinase family protein [Stenotrophomonas sp. MMGLT7]MCD7099965.1 glucokinase [Stenotrophomonas sp. MMGLT7]
MRAPAPFLAADVGGTHVRVGRVQASGDRARPVSVLDYRKYRCADFPSLSSILEDFRSSGPAVRDCVIASAGFPLADGSVITTNLPWPLSLPRIRQDLELASVHLVNDFEAVAHATAYVDASEMLQLAGPAHRPPGPMLVLGPGTGLGAAVWIPTEHGPVVLPTEAGQAALASNTELEMALVRHMLRERSHVSVEHALSGPGLMNLYRALCAIRGTVPLHAAPGDITAAALAGSDPLAVESLEVFCGLLGSTVGDMALLYGIQGGIHLAGGILPQIRDFLIGSRFVPRFLDKGPMREALERIPVKLVEHGQLGVLGAASWFIGRTQAATPAQQ